MTRLSHVDHSLYVCKSDVEIVPITIYVDDLIIVGDSETKIEHVKGLLKEEFEMKDLGELRYFLGIEVIRTADGIWLSQRQYALDMLSKYGMADCKPISMPLDVNVKLSAHAGDALENITMYRKIVGSLIYLTITRPDLSYTVGLESQFMQAPKKPHLDAVRRTLRYVRATLDHALFYAAGVPVELYGYTDALYGYIGLVVSQTGDLLAALCFLLGVLLLLGAARSIPQLPCRVQRLSTEVLLLRHVR